MQYQSVITEGLDYVKKDLFSCTLSRILIQLLFFASVQFWASGDNLGLKRAANYCKRVAF